MTEKGLDAALRSLEIEAMTVNYVRERLDRAAFARAVDAIAGAPRIMTCAGGSSGIAAKKFAHTLCCIEQNAMFMPPCEAIHGGLGGLKTGDVIVIVSRGGKTAELLPVMEVAVKKKAVLIAVTENMESPIAQNADIILPLTLKEESDPTGLMATASYVATIAIFDAIISALIVETGYTREMFGLIHPGGAVGALLNNK